MAAPTTPALTIAQPWATLIMQGRKTIETRSWPTGHRGRLVIHSASRHVYTGGKAGFLGACRYFHVDPDACPMGVILGHVDLVAVQVVDQAPVPDDQRDYGDFTPGRYAWLLRDPTPLPTPIPARGQRGVWHTPYPA